MQKTTVISNSKIIFLVAFICCALMTSLFVFHLRNKHELMVLADGNATIFPIARDLKPFKLASTNGPQFSQQDLMGHWTIAFFGFTHCSSVCPTTLNLFANVYDKLHTNYPNMQVVFISLDPERDSIDKLGSYVHTFNSNFIGATGKMEDIRKLQSEFGIFSAREEANQHGDYQLQHTPSILLINPEGKWAGLFKSNITALQFITAFTASVQHHG